MTFKTFLLNRCLSVKQEWKWEGFQYDNKRTIKIKLTFQGNHIPGGMRDFTHAYLKHSQLLEEGNVRVVIIQFVVLLKTL